MTEEEIETTGKKRGAERQLRKGDEEEEEETFSTDGTWSKADASTLAGRRKVKIRRGASQSLVPENMPEISAPPVLSGSPVFKFEIPPSSSSSSASNEGEKKEVQTEVGTFTLVEGESKQIEAEKKEGGTSESKKEETSSSSSSSSSSPLKSPTPFTFATSFAFSSSFAFPAPSAPSSFATFGSASAPPPAGSGHIFGHNIPPPATKTAEVSFGSENPAPVASSVPIPSTSSNPETGEENETTVFQGRGKLFTFDKKEGKWVERGVGNMKVNVAKDRSFSRLVMRMDHSLKLILNVSLFPGMKCEKPEAKGVRFLAVEGPSQPVTFLFRASSPDLVDKFIQAVDENKNLKKEEKKEEKTEPKAT